MLTTRPAKSLIALALILMALATIGWAISAQWVSAGRGANNTAPLDWYFAHDHAIPDGDNYIVSSDKTSIGSQLAPLDWYFAHDHAVIDGDGNIVSGETRQGDRRWAPLDWYLTHDHAILDGDHNILDR